MSTINIPYISTPELSTRASNFLAEYNKEEILPVPIEEITELRLKISVIPIPNLSTILGVESFITCDFKNIYLDQFSYENRPERTRFTCAHEIGHYVLHRKAYEAFEINDIDSYIKFQNSTTIETEKRLEFQAHIFAGYLLMPTTKFLKMAKDLIGSGGSINKISILEAQNVLQKLSETFGVSTDATLKQLKYEYKEFFHILINCKG